MSKKLSQSLEPASRFFNWGEISRRFSGTRSVIRKESIPDVHEPIIKKIVSSVDTILREEGIIK